MNSNANQIGINHQNETEYCSMKSIQNSAPLDNAIETHINLDRRGLSRYNDFRHLLPIKRTTVYKWMKVNKFPKPVISEHNFTAWRTSEILEWLENPRK